MTVSATLDALPDAIAPARVARLMLWSIAGFTATAIGWAALTTVPETAMAPGRVVPSRQLQVLSHPEGGVIQAILARPGQHVEKGQVLLRLDPAVAAADLGRGSAASGALAARLARLSAEAAGRDPDFAGLDAAAVAAERAVHSARMAEIGAAAAGEMARLDGARRALAEAEAARRVQAEVRSQAAREVATLQPLVDKGIEPRISLDRARSQLVQTEAAAGAASQAVARADASVAEARAALASVTSRFRTQAADQLAGARAEMAAQSAGLPALQGRMDRTLVRSPIAGTVQRVLVGTVGGSVAPGAPLAEVVPAGDALVVEARLRPQDIGFVRPGQPANVKLTAYDASLYGALPGKVVQISPDAVVDERSGESWYQVRVATADRLKAPGGEVLPVAPGMVAEVDLLGRERSVLSYILSPVTRITDRAFRER